MFISHCILSFPDNDVHSSVGIIIFSESSRLNVGCTYVFMIKVGIRLRYSLYVLCLLCTLCISTSEMQTHKEVRLTANVP